MSIKLDEPQRSGAGKKVYDPIFLCMIGAIVLAVGTSVALRAMVGAGAARADAGGEGVPVVHGPRPVQQRHP